MFVFDAVDTYGETRFKREIFPMKCLLEGLDELNGNQVHSGQRQQIYAAKRTAGNAA